MRTLLFDPFSGAAGDMVVASLLDAGASASAVKRAVDPLPVSVRTARVRRGHLRATQVRFDGDKWSGTVADVERTLRDAGPGLRRRALATLRALARVEARIHGTTPSKFRFHDVDTPADVVGAWAALESLGPGSVLALPVSVGGGPPTADGFPVPAPATLALLQGSGLEWRGGPVEGELLTPTGAALLATMASAATPFYPPMKVESVGHGAGSHPLRAIPNVLRTVVGQERAPVPLEEIAVLETTVDDVTGELLGHLREVLMGAGAHDVAFLPALMKKGRPGHVVQVIAEPRSSLRLAEIIARETGTLGVRFAPAGHRMVAAREMRTVRLRLRGRSHPVRVKVASLGGRVFHISAEFEDVRKAARASGLPAREVAARAEEEARKRLKKR